jgi:hypothetical protein
VGVIVNSLSFWTQQQAQGFDEYRHTHVVYARIPTKTDCVASGCGWDELSQSAVNPACLVCGGVGKTLTWVNYNINCRLMWTNQIKFAYPYPTTGTEMGDCVIVVPYEFVGVMDAVMSNELAYIVANDKNVKPKSKQEQYIPGIIREYEYVANLYSPPAT